MQEAEGRRQCLLVCLVVAGDGHHGGLTRSERNEVAAEVAKTFLKVTNNKPHLTNVESEQCI